MFMVSQSLKWLAAGWTARAHSGQDFGLYRRVQTSCPVGTDTFLRSGRPDGA
jgi:hypothetical protein